MIDNSNILNSSFTALYTMYYDLAVAMVYSLEKNCRYAEDIVQDVFVKLLSDMEKTGEVINMKAYLFIMVRNRYLIYRRKNNRTLLHEQTLFEQYATEPADQKANFNSAFTVIESVINKLPTKRRRVFKLSRFDGYSHKEIADQLDIHPVTVAQYIMKSMETLELVKTEVHRLCA